MKQKSTYFLILLMIIGFIPKLFAQVQDDTIRTLIFTELYGPSKTKVYAEITNVGDEPVNLSDFELGTTRYSIQFPGTFENRIIRLPNIMLQPDSSYLIAKVNDYQDNYGRYLRPWEDQRKYGIEKTWDEILMKLDTAIYDDEDAEGRQGGLDSISTNLNVINFNTGIGIYLEQHVGEDSVIVDGVRIALDENGYPDRDEKFATVAGIPLAYSNYVLVRKTNVNQGSWDWDKQRGNSIADSEWLPIPDRSNGYYYNTSRWFTTLRHHGNATLNSESVSSDNIVIDWENEKMTVPWGIYRDSIMNYFHLTGGLAWHLHWSPSVSDSTSRIVVTGDTLTMYAVGEDLEQIDFALEVADPADNMNLVFPKNLRTLDEETLEYDWSTPFYVTNDDPEMDTIGDISFGLRVDTLFKYIEKAPDASLEFVWVDGTERVDLKFGDILKVKAKDGTEKDYFLDVDVEPEVSNNAFLGAITWPDAPSYLRESPQWNDDTIPNFSNGIFAYELKVPYGTMNVPSLMAIPENLNAEISIERATVISGPVEDRTTTFTVTADTTINIYSVIFSMEKPDELVQPFSADPVFTQLYHMRTWNNRAMEISNPGNQPLDLSDYMIVIGAASNPAEIITTYAEAYDDRFKRYVPGYKFQTEDLWGASPNTILRDYDVNPIIEPGGSFVIARARNQDYASVEAAQYYDVMMTLESYGVVLDEEASGCKGYYIQSSKQYVSFWRYNEGQLCLFKIVGDSIKDGLKPITDPNDFELVDMLGNWTGDTWDPIGEPIPSDEHVMERKPEFWKGDTLPGQLGSFGANAEESEWIYTQIESWGNAYDILTSGAIGSHSFDPVFDYSSTVTSFVYKVSDGFVSPQSISGVPTGTTVSEFMPNIDAAPGQGLVVMGKTDTDLLAEGDTLLVTSADSANTTKYSISIGSLSSDALLTAKDGSGYTIELVGNEGTISGIPFGATIPEVLDNVLKPGSAVLNVIDSYDNLVPMQVRNFDGEYVDTKASSMIIFEVIAEDGVTKNLYQLELDISDSDAYLYSDLYDVDENLLLVSSIPLGTTVPTLRKFLFPNDGASMKIVNKTGTERVKGDIVSDDQIIVTSADQSVEKVYFINLLDLAMGTQAYVVSTVLSVDQQQYVISGIPENTLYNIFLGLITPAEGATVVLLDSNQQPVESGPIGDGYTLVVTSGDQSAVVTYTLSVMVSVNNLTLEQFKIYPNPATDEIFVDGLEVNYEITIKDISGQTVKFFDQKNVLNGSISVGDLPAGIYLIYATFDNQHSRPVKLIKQ